VGRATRTVNPLHFEDLEPHRFEDLIRQLAHDFRPWLRIEATGRLGKDEGVDIRAIEGVSEVAVPDAADEEVDDDAPIFAEREWRVQCKRYKTLHPKEMRQFVREAVGDGAPPLGLILAAACDVSTKTLDAFHDEARALGVIEHQLWMKAHVEDMLFRPENDGLLFGYFGISLTAKRRSRLQDLRHDIAIKRKLVRLLEMKDMEHPIKYTDMLVRDIEDTHYPRHDEVPGFDALDCPPWHVVIPEAFHHKGLVVARWRYPAWVRKDGSWDMLEEHRFSAGNMMGSDYRRQLAEAFGLEDKEWRHPYAEIMERVPMEEHHVLSEAWLLPLSSILLIDDLGEETYAGPHLFCAFNNGEQGPYAGKLLGLTYHPGYGDTRRVDSDDRQPLFKQLVDGTLVLPENSEQDPSTPRG
jgi:hypothetical protein